MPDDIDDPEHGSGNATVGDEKAADALLSILLFKARRREFPKNAADLVGLVRIMEGISCNNGDHAAAQGLHKICLPLRRGFQSSRYKR